MPKSPIKVAVFPGAFDPITLGHVDVIDRGRKLFDQLIVAVGHNPDKVEMFSVEDRLAMIREVVGQYRNVRVEAYTGLTVDLVRRRKAVAILRGLRNMTDLDYEFQIALTNRAVANVETVFVMTSEQFGFTSSSLIKQVAVLGGNLEQFAKLLPRGVIDRMKAMQAAGTGIFARPVPDALKR